MVLKVFPSFSDWYLTVNIDCNVLVASLVGKTRLFLQEAKGFRRYNGPGYDKRYLMVISIKIWIVLPLQSTIT